MIFTGLRNAIIVIVASMVLQSCYHDDHQNDISDLGCGVENKTINERLKEYEILKISDTVKTKELNVEFYNNTCNIDSTYQLALILESPHGKYLLYNQKFHGSGIKIKVPSQYISKFNGLWFLLSKNGKLYNFYTEELCKLDDNDGVLQIIFLTHPDEYYEFHFIFTPKNKIVCPY